ncbi:DUF1764 family protein [Rhodotorula toruloides]|uniref:BY PROTMAP: gi/472583486/gb/EMS21119.1/ DUF1764 family protein [Rhodosporidium toruloides NP11] gi/647396849/emb/CDR39465.1/ RHTO0S04e05424g1_1 [Rhodosporidium toruloides] n=1 Tax=Rhodotorula toruloides TaxID=5286 RepID=A0A0K3C698_RHOTO|nr:DUF1764 family protein [Rhodotorula toruloides]PRQ77558.1 Eukaryotic protein of unknown function (DUF1764)-domain containing protein [Rhodotorula toruloides]
MAKAATQAPSQASSKPAEAGKKRKGGEIDDIFAAAKKPKLPAAAAATGSSGAGTAEGGAAEEKKGKKGKKAALGAAEGAVAKPSRTDEAVEEDAAPRRVPETVVDTSKTIETYKPPPLARKQLGENATEEEKRAAEEEERFMDSRGNRKRTEDGLPIYSEAELKIGFGGDTPLCPFDCECCY